MNYQDEALLDMQFEEARSRWDYLGEALVIIGIAILFYAAVVIIWA